jgi:hypothetical protein
MRGIQYAVAYAFKRWCRWNTGSPGQAGRRPKQTRLFVLATRHARVLHESCPSKLEGAARPSSEGAGKTGCPPHPQPRVQNRKHTSVVATGRGGFIRPSLRNGFNGLLRALPGDRAFLPPSSTQCASIVADLMPASGHQDHAASPSASNALRLARHRVHRIPGPTLVTIAKRPSSGPERHNR